MALRIVQVPETPEEIEKRKLDWLHSAPNAVIACRGQGHAFPKLKPGKNPKGIRHQVREGQVELVTTCRDGCGKERRIVTAPGVGIELPAKYTYNNPEGYRAPKGLGVTRRDCFEEAVRRTREDIEEAAKLAAKQAAQTA